MTLYRDPPPFWLLPGDWPGKKIPTRICIGLLVRANMKSTTLPEMRFGVDVGLMRSFVGSGGASL